MEEVEVLGGDKEGLSIGRIDGKEGLFPSNFVEIMESDAGNLGEGTGFNVLDYMNQVTLYIRYFTSQPSRKCGILKRGECETTLYLIKTPILCVIDLYIAVFVQTRS